MEAKARGTAASRAERERALTLRRKDYGDNGEFSPCIYTLVRQGERTAWTNSSKDATLAEAMGGGGVIFTEGADLMPRTVVFHKTISRPGGHWDFEPIPENSSLRYLIDDAYKKNCKSLVAAGVSGVYIHGNRHTGGRLQREDYRSHSA